MFPLKLEIKSIQYDISAKCNEVTLTTNLGKLVFCVDTYNNFIDIDLLKSIVEIVNKQSI